MAKWTSIVLILAIVALGLLYLDSKMKLKQSREALITSSEEVILWKDEYGRSNAELGVLKLDYQSFILTQERIVDSLKAIKIKPKTVAKIQNVTLMTSDTVYITRNKPFLSPWSTIGFVADDSISYSFKDSLSLVTYHKKYGFLHLKSKYVTRAISFNPNTRLTGLTTVEIIPKTRRISLGGFAGYGLQFRDSQVFPGWIAGIGISFKLF
jgi:hypothetical protein